MIQDRLLLVAAEQFGLHGFEGATTREIARLSETAMSSITYHFGGKRGLYLAVADHISNRVQQLMGPQCDHAGAAIDSVSRDEAIELLLDLLEGLARLMLEPESEAWALLILREQQRPTDAFDRLFASGMQSVVTIFLRLVARVRPDLSEDERRAMTVLIYGQALILRACRASVLRVLERDDIGEAEASLLLAQLRRNARSILSEGSDG